MQFTITGDFAKALLSSAKKDRNLARSLAQQFCRTIDLQTIGAYLITPEVAMNLLMERLTKDPEGTVTELQRMESGVRPAKQTGARGRRPGRPAMNKIPGRRGRPAGSKNVRLATSPKAPRGKGRRLRLNRTEVELLKATVQQYLNQHPWSTRMQIVRAANLPTQAIYNRVMGELRKQGKVVAQGQKAKAVYALKGAKAGKMPTASVKKTSANNTSKKRKAAGRKPGRPAAKVAKVAKVAKKTADKPRKVRAPQFCPVPGCANKAAPAFGMLCKEHKDIPAAERERYFAERRAMTGNKTAESV